MLEREIEGLQELRDAIKKERDYIEALGRAAEENTCFPVDEYYGYTDLVKKYPRAAAYVSAEDFIKFGDPTQAKNGKIALKLLLDEENDPGSVEWAMRCNAFEVDFALLKNGQNPFAKKGGTK